MTEHFPKLQYSSLIIKGNLVSKPGYPFFGWGGLSALLTEHTNAVYFKQNGTQPKQVVLTLLDELLIQ